MPLFPWNEDLEREVGFGIDRIYPNFEIPDDRIHKYDVYDVRHPQWIFPVFEFDSGRIIERLKGEWGMLTGKYNVVRPMPGTRSDTSCFYIISGNPPTNDKYRAIFIPEGWIGLDDDVAKYRKLLGNGHES